MNRIKIIKRENLPSAAVEKKARKADRVDAGRQAVKVVGNWIDEWRASKPKDARRAFAELFNTQPSAAG